MPKLTQKQREAYERMYKKKLANPSKRVKQPTMSKAAVVQRASRHAAEDRKLAKHLGLDKQDLW